MFPLEVYVCIPAQCVRGWPGRWIHSSWGWQTAAAECEGRGWGSARWAPEKYQWVGGDFIVHHQFCSGRVSQQGEFFEHPLAFSPDRFACWLLPGTCAERGPGFWCRRPPSSWLARSGSAAPGPSSSARPGTEPGRTARCFREGTAPLTQAQRWVHLTARFLKAFMQACRSGLSGCWSWGEAMNQRVEGSLMKPSVLLDICSQKVWCWPPCVGPAPWAAPGSAPAWWRVCWGWWWEPGYPETTPPLTPCTRPVPRWQANKGSSATKSPDCYFQDPVCGIWLDSWIFTIFLPKHFYH